MGAGLLPPARANLNEVLCSDSTSFVLDLDASGGAGDNTFTALQHSDICDWGREQYSRLHCLRSSLDSTSKLVISKFLIQTFIVIPMSVLTNIPKIRHMIERHAGRVKQGFKVDIDVIKVLIAQGNVALGRGQ